MKKILLGLLILFACVFLHAQVNLDSGLVGCYPFTGNANDMSGNGNNGVVHNATLATDRFGNPNCAYSINRADTGHILIANFPTMIPAYDVSISIWGQVNGNTSTGLFVTEPDSEKNRFGGFAEYDGTDLIWDYGSILSSSGRMLLSQTHDVNWHHYVFQVSKTENIKEIYLDGVLVDSSAYGMDYRNSGRPLWLGAGPNWSGSGGGGLLDWTGSIDDVRIYNRALTHAEVNKLYTATSTIGCIIEGIPSLSESGIKIYQSSPGQMEIKVGSVPINGSLEVINVLGQVMLAKTMDAAAYSTQAVTIANMPKGMYFLVLASGNERYTQKFIK